MILKTDLTRRDFLRMLSAGTCGAVAHNVLSPFGGMLAMAQDAPANYRTVILLYMYGGWSHSAIGIRRAWNPEWFRQWGGVNGLAYDDTTAINNRTPVLIGEQSYLNPGLDSLKFAFDAGHGLIVNKVGIVRNSTRSHDEDTSKVQSGEIPNGAGIIGRAVSDVLNPLTGVSLDGSSLLVQGSGKQALSLADLDNLGIEGIGGKTEEFKEFSRLFVEAGAPLASGNALYLKDARDNLNYTISTIKDAIKSPLPNPADYQNGDGFMRSCYDAARLIRARPLGVRLIALGRGGWDTHSGARNTVFQNCNSVGRGLAALIKTLQQSGLWEQTAILTMSEFSRTAWNGPDDPTANQTTNGDDHGNAGPHLCLSGALTTSGVLNNPADAAEVLAMKNNYLNVVDVDHTALYRNAFRWAGFDDSKIFAAPSATHQFTMMDYLKA